MIKIIIIDDYYLQMPYIIENNKLILHKVFVLTSHILQVLGKVRKVIFLIGPQDQLRFDMSQLKLVPQNVEKIKFRFEKKFLSKLFLPISRKIGRMIRFDDYFNLPVDNIPLGTEYLHLGLCFNHPVDNLPCGLRYLRLGKRFNKPLDFLPESLTHLFFNGEYHFPLYNLPNSLKFLLFNDNYYGSLDNLPDNIEVIIFGYSMDENGCWNMNYSPSYMVGPSEPVRRLPKNLKYFLVNGNYDWLMDMRLEYPNVKFITEESFSFPTNFSISI